MHCLGRLLLGYGMYCFVARKREVVHRRAQTSNSRHAMLFVDLNVCAGLIKLKSRFIAFINYSHHAIQHVAFCCCILCLYDSRRSLGRDL